jgi:hypothetical protein
MRSARRTITPAELRGPHHTIADVVQTEGYYHEFRIQSDFGTFDTAGRSMLAVRLHEVDERDRKELKATTLVIVLTGKASSAASKELAARGWRLGRPS